MASSGAADRSESHPQPRPRRLVSDLKAQRYPTSGSTCRVVRQVEAQRAREVLDCEPICRRLMGERVIPAVLEPNARSLTTPSERTCIECGLHDLGPAISDRSVRYGAQMAKAVTISVLAVVFITDHAGAGEPTGAGPAIVVDGKLAKGGESLVIKKPPPIAKVPVGHTAVDRKAESFPATT